MRVYKYRNPNLVQKHSLAEMRFRKVRSDWSHSKVKESSTTDPLLTYFFSYSIVYV